MKKLREKQKIVKKIDSIETLVQDKSDLIRTNIIDKKNSGSWQRSIGYVPQEIFIADDTLAANIAFGVDKKDINQDQLQDISKPITLDDITNPNKK